MKLSNGKRAFGYIRVSDPDQVQGYSLEAQESAIRQWCERNGYELVRIFSEEGKSAHVDDSTRWNHGLVSFQHDSSVVRTKWIRTCRLCQSMMATRWKPFAMGM